MENMKYVRAIDSLDEMTVIIKNELENITEGFVAVGYYLKKTRDDGLHRQKGYESLFDYAKDTFGISRFTATRFMEINDRYSIGGYSPQIEDRWRGYGSSKLTEMLGLPEDIIEDVPKEATVADIREVKKTIRETEGKYSAQYELCDIAQEKPQEEPEEENWLTRIIKYYFLHEGRGRFREFVIWLKSNNSVSGWNIEMDVLEMVNPSKFKMLRLPTANVLMQSDCIKVMPYRDQGEKAEYTYIEFAREFEKVFYPDYPDMGKTAEQVFETVYGIPLAEPEKIPAGSDPETSSGGKNPKKKTETKKAETKKPEPLAEAGAEEETKDREEIPGQMEITRDMPEYCPEEQPEEPEKPEYAVSAPDRETEENISEGYVIEDILKSGDIERIMALLMAEFPEPAAGWKQWKDKVVMADVQ